MKLSRPWQYEEAKLIDFLECLVDGFSTFYHLFQPFPVTHVDFGSFFQSGWKTTETSAEPQGYPEIPRCIIIFLKDSSDVYIIIYIYIYYIILYYIIYIYIMYIIYIYTIYIYIYIYTCTMFSQSQASNHWGYLKWYPPKSSSLEAYAHSQCLGMGIPYEYH